MLETIVFYFLFFAFIFILSNVINKADKLIYRYILIIFVSLFIGLRYDVGIDYLTYLDEYNLSYYYLNERFEFFPSFSQHYLSSNNFPFYYWFCLMAFIQICFFLNYFKDKRIVLLPIGIILFFIMYLSSINNLIRQMCAVLIFFNAIQFIEKRKIIPYILLILFGSLFHKSILIMLPFFYVNKLNFVDLKFLTRLIILFCSFFVGVLLNKYIFIFFDIFIYLGYEYTVGNFDLNDTLMIKEGSGLGRLMNWILIILVMYLNDKMKVFYIDKAYFYNTIFNLFFIYCFFYEFTGHVLYFQRIFLYFTFTNFLMYTFLIYYCFKVKTKQIIFLKILGFTVLSFQLIIFIISILGENKNLSPLKFIN